jgi:hypothetical protein
MQSQKTHYVLIIITFVFFFCFIVAYKYFDIKQVSEQTHSFPNPTNQIRSSIVWPKDITFANFENITIKDISSSECKTNKGEYINCLSEVYLTNKNTGVKSLILTTDNLVTDSRLPEFSNGSLYVVKRTGNAKYPSDNWTDELWQYKENQPGKLIHSYKGLTFSASPDGQYICIVTEQNVLVIKNSGPIAKQYPRNQLYVSSYENEGHDIVAWWNEDLWINSNFGPSVTGLIKIKLTDFSVSKYDFTGLKIGTEFKLNAESEKIVYSNYPAIFDQETDEYYQRSKLPVKLSVYDLNTKTSKVISTSVFKRFNPTWVDSKTIKYNSPTSDQSITYSDSR